MQSPACRAVSFPAARITQVEDWMVSLFTGSRKISSVVPLTSDWLQALGYPPDREPSKYSSICSLHFREEHIDRTSLSSVRLRDDAVPTVAYQSEPVTPSRSHSESPYPASASSSAPCSASGSETVDIGQSTTASPPSPVPHQAVPPVHVEHSSIQEPTDHLWEYAAVGTEPTTSVEKVSSAAALPSDMRHLAVHVEHSDVQETILG
ncbi:uncharacterized protein LOC135377705 [Ornithodoros turicata]|uniref:uncharacterized protein LOC135377705 n=1 Tax=Ornithodoros turicata TaxID=34597 RepID=UPI003139BF60